LPWLSIFKERNKVQWSHRKILKFHGFFLTGLGGMACVNSIVGFNFSKGPFQFLGANEVAAVGFIEAYGLACLLGFGLMIAAKKSYHYSWHLMGAAIHLFLFLVNVSFWHLYEPLNLKMAGLIATAFHFCLIILEVNCFINEKRNEFA
jgi:hypothetical protein